MTDKHDVTHNIVAPSFAVEMEFAPNSIIEYNCNPINFKNENNETQNKVEVSCGSDGDWVYPVPMTKCVEYKECDEPSLPAEMTSNYVSPVRNGIKIRSLFVWPIVHFSKVLIYSYLFPIAGWNAH